MALGTIIGGVTSLFGSGLSYKGQREANKTNIQLAKEARQHDVDMWNMQNAYNTPEMQMQRLREAGLNPNLMYGTGSASTGNADSPKPAHVATTSNELASFNANNAISMLSAYQDWQVKKAQIKNIEAETQAKIYGNQYQEYLAPWFEILAHQEARKKTWDADRSHSQALSIYQDWTNKQYQHMADVKHGAYEARSLMPGARLNESKERFEFLKRQILHKDIQIELDEQFKPFGVTTTDELWQRLLAPVIRKAGDALNDWIDNSTKYFKNPLKK